MKYLWIINNRSKDQNKNTCTSQQKPIIQLNKAWIVCVCVFLPYFKFLTLFHASATARLSFYMKCVLFFFLVYIVQMIPNWLNQ